MQPKNAFAKQFIAFHATRNSRIETLNFPAFPCRLAAPDEAVMQAKRPVRPEFDLDRRDLETAPKRRARRVRALARRYPRHLGHQRGARRERARLLGCPGPQPALERAGGEIGIRLLALLARDMAAKPHLTAQRFPVQHAR